MGTGAQDISGGNEPALPNHLILTGKLHTCLDDLNEQAWERYQLIVRQMAGADGTDEDLKCWSQLEWT